MRGNRQDDNPDGQAAGLGGNRRAKHKDNPFLLRLGSGHLRFITTEPLSGDRLPVRLPRAFGESDRGYLLRLADATGHRKAAHLLPFVELREGRFGGGGARGSLPEPISIEGGPELPPIRFDIGRPKVCPACLVERQVLELAWDVRLCTVCRRHGCRLLCECPACSAPLIWKRKHWLRCDCGFTFADATPIPASAAEVALVSAIMADPSSDRSENPVRLAPDLLLLSATEIMDVVIFVASLANRLTRKKSFFAKGFADPRAMLAAVRLAADALADWPLGFIRVMGPLARAFWTEEARDIRFVGSTIPVGGKMERQRFRFLFDLYDLFVTFAGRMQTEWVLAAHPNLISVTDMAREYGVPYVTAGFRCRKMRMYFPFPWNRHAYVEREEAARFHAALEARVARRRPPPEPHPSRHPPKHVAAVLGLDFDGDTRDRKIAREIRRYVLGEPLGTSRKPGYPPKRLSRALERIEALKPRIRKPGRAAKVRRDDLDLFEICLRSGILVAHVLDLALDGTVVPTAFDATAVGLRRLRFDEKQLKRALAERYNAATGVGGHKVDVVAFENRWWNGGQHPIRQVLPTPVYRG